MRTTYLAKARNMQHKEIFEKILAKELPGLNGIWKQLQDLTKDTPPQQGKLATKEQISHKIAFLQKLISWVDKNTLQQKTEQKQEDAHKLSISENIKAKAVEIFNSYKLKEVLKNEQLNETSWNKDKKLYDNAVKFQQYIKVHSEVLSTCLNTLKNAEVKNAAIEAIEAIKAMDFKTINTDKCKLIKKNAQAIIAVKDLVGKDELKTVFDSMGEQYKSFEETEQALKATENALNNISQVQFDYSQLKKKSIEKFEELMQEHEDPLNALEKKFGIKPPLNEDDDQLDLNEDDGQLENINTQLKTAEDQKEKYEQQLQDLIQVEHKQVQKNLEILQNLQNKLKNNNPFNASEKKQYNVVIQLITSLKELTKVLLDIDKKDNWKKAIEKSLTTLSTNNDQVSNAKIVFEIGCRNQHKKGSEKITGIIEALGNLKLPLQSANVNENKKPQVDEITKAVEEGVSTLTQVRDALQPVEKEVTKKISSLESQDKLLNQAKNVLTEHDDDYWEGEGLSTESIKQIIIERQQAKDKIIKNIDKLFTTEKSQEQFETKIMKFSDNDDLAIKTGQKNGTLSRSKSVLNLCNVAQSRKEKAEQVAQQLQDAEIKINQLNSEKQEVEKFTQLVENNTALNDVLEGWHEYQEQCKDILVLVKKFASVSKAQQKNKILQEIQDVCPRFTLDSDFNSSSTQQWLSNVKELNDKDKDTAKICNEITSIIEVIKTNIKEITNDNVQNIPSLLRITSEGLKPLFNKLWKHHIIKLAKSYNDQIARLCNEQQQKCEEQKQKYETQDNLVDMYALPMREEVPGEDHQKQQKILEKEKKTFEEQQKELKRLNDSKTELSNFIKCFPKAEVGIKDGIWAHFTNEKELQTAVEDYDTAVNGFDLKKDINIQECMSFLTRIDANITTINAIAKKSGHMDDPQVKEHLRLVQTKQEEVEKIQKFLQKFEDYQKDCDDFNVMLMKITDKDERIKKIKEFIKIHKDYKKNIKALKAEVEKSEYKISQDFENALNSNQNKLQKLLVDTQNIDTHKGGGYHHPSHTFADFSTKKPTDDSESKIPGDQEGSVDTNIFKSVWNGFYNVGKGAFNFVVGIFTGVVNFVTELILGYKTFADDDASSGLKLGSDEDDYYKVDDHNTEDNHGKVEEDVITSDLVDPVNA